jgi:hypothetical protein
MLLIALMIFLAIAGWNRWPWWVPFALWVVAIAMHSGQLGAINAWREETGLSPHPFETLVPNAVLTLTVYLFAYWIARGVRKALSASETAS